MTFRRAALARAQPAPTGGAGLHIGWNWRLTDNLDNGLIDVYANSALDVRQNFTNANGDSVDAHWVTSPSLSSSDNQDGSTQDVRLRGDVRQQTSYNNQCQWQIYCPPGVYKLWCGSGWGGGTNANIVVKVYDGTLAVGGVPLIEFHSGPVPSAQFVNMDNVFRSEANWVAEYDAVDVTVTVTDRDADTALRLSYELDVGNSFMTLQHTRIQQQ